MTQDPEPDEIVEYIASMLSQLEVMARKSDKELLAYLIGMAHIEATNGAAAKFLAGRKKRDSAA